MADLDCDCSPKFHIVATSFEEHAFFSKKYPESERFLRELNARSKKQPSCTVDIMFEVDATKLHTHSTRSRIKQYFDQIIFNFPHLGFEVSRLRSIINFFDIVSY